MEIPFDPKTTALVVIDLQNGIVARRDAGPYSPQDVIRNARTLADSLRAKGATIVWVHVKLDEVLRLNVDQPMPSGATPPPPSAWDLVPELGVQASDVIILKRQWGAFYGTNLEQQLRRRGIRTIIMAGIATSIGVESTARAAYDQGYELIFAEDAMTSVSKETHDCSTTRIFPRMGRVRTTEEIVKGGS
jgi:nicotinamidase-related amidase